MTPDEAVEAIGKKLIACGVRDVAVGTAALYWTTKSGKRWSWHLTVKSLPIAMHVLAVLSELVRSPNNDGAVRDAALSLLELVQLAIIGAGGYRSDWGSQNL